MTDAELNAIRERCNAATAGPWVDIQEHCPESANGQRYCTKASVYCYGPNSHANIRFCTNARQDIPVLLAEVERLRAIVQAEDGQ